jgi:hypothetical protein
VVVVTVTKYSWLNGSSGRITVTLTWPARVASSSLEEVVHVTVTEALARATGVVVVTVTKYSGLNRSRGRYNCYSHLACWCS